MRVSNFLRGFLLAALAAGSGGLHATDRGAIRQAVEGFMAGQRDKILSQYSGSTRLEYQIAGLDPRLALQPCPAPLRLEAQQQAQFGGRLNVQVSCPAGNRWMIYVPVELAVYRPVVVAMMPLARGQNIGAGDVGLKEFNVARVNGQYLTSLDAAVGMAPRRNIGQDSILLADQLDPPLLIKRGDAVMISAEGDAISVKMPGVALTDGRRGEQIRIKNTSSSRVVQARVVAPGQAHIVM